MDLIVQSVWLPVCHLEKYATNIMESLPLVSGCACTKFMTIKLKIWLTCGLALRKPSMIVLLDTTDLYVYTLANLNYADLTLCVLIFIHKAFL